MGIMRVFLFSSIILVGFIWGCSDDRLNLLADSQKIASENFVQNTDSIFTNLEYKFQKFEFSKTTQNPIIGSKGTLLYLPSIINFSNQENQGIEAPIQIELLELLKPKDFILNDKYLSTLNEIVSTAGIIDLKISKINQELFLNTKTKSVFRLVLKSNNIGSVNSYLGKTNDKKEFLWTKEKFGSGDNSFPIENSYDENVSGYSFFINDFKWLGYGKTASFENSNSSPILISSNLTELDKIRSYLYVPSLNTVLKIDGEQSIMLPIDTKVKLVSFAFTDNKILYFFIKEHIIASSNKIEINLQASDIATFEAELDKL